MEKIVTASAPYGYLVALMRRYEAYRNTEIPGDISPFDDMFDPGNAEHYYSVGRSAINVIAETMFLARKQAFDSILDLPCGGGRVTRHLVSFFPDADIFVSDIDSNKEKFVLDTLPVIRAAVSPDFTNSSEQKFDLIFVGSLVTHFGEEHLRRALLWLAEALNDDGVLIVTSHGRTSADLSREIYLSADWRLVYDSYLKTGFGFRMFPEQKGLPIAYGGNLASPSWLMKVAESIPQVRILNFREGAWDQHHDALVIQKRSIGSRAPLE